MKIKEGYNGKTLEIRIVARDKQSGAEVWLGQHGLPEDVATYRDTLSYASLNELIELRDECNEAIKKIAGV